MDVRHLEFVHIIAVHVVSRQSPIFLARMCAYKGVLLIPIHMRKDALASHFTPALSLYAFQLVPIAPDATPHRGEPVSQRTAYIFTINP